MKKFIYFSLIFSVFCLSCENEEFDPTSAETIVLEAYLFSGQPVTEIKVTRLIPFIVEDANQNFEVDDANITISWNQQEFNLMQTEGRSGYYHYPDNDLEIIVGETYEINFEYFGEEISASTIVPTQPVDLEISHEELEIPPIESFQDLFFNTEIETIEVLWNNQSADYFYVTVSNIESNPEPVDVNGILNDLPIRNFLLVTEPTNLDFYNIIGRTLDQYGTYQVEVFKVNQEYVDLYETAEQDSRNLNEPLSNVNNGLGIFTSFNSSSIEFEVVKP